MDQAMNPMSGMGLGGMGAPTDGTSTFQGLPADQPSHSEALSSSFNASTMASTLLKNSMIIMFCRNFMAVLGGSMAGILGLTSIQGFLFYMFISLITSLGFMIKANFKPQLYFKTVRQPLLDSIFDRGTVLSFTLFWTLLYGVIHIF